MSKTADKAGSRWADLDVNIWKFSPTAQSPRRIFKRYSSSCIQTGNVHCILTVWRSMPLFHQNYMHPLPFPVLSLEENIEKQESNLGQIRSAIRVRKKACIDLAVVKKKEKGSPANRSFAGAS